jgi:HrpA-like RNA helicase
MSTSPTPNYDPENILKSLLVGNFQNIALLQTDGSYKTLYTRQTVFIHPSSCLFGKKKPAIVYSELVSTSKKYLKNVSSIPIEWILKHKLHNLRQ